MIVVCFHLLSSQREAKIRVAAPVAIKARELMIATYLVGEYLDYTQYKKAPTFAVG